MIIEELEQGTSDWLAMRVGRVTASRVCDVMAVLKKKEGEAADRRNYRNELVVENLTGLSAETFVSPAMQWGIDTEPLGRAAYEHKYDVMVEQVGFAVHPRIDRFGASPDGLVGSDGMVEIKCPNTATHLQYLLLGTVPEDYQPQMLAEMACAERQWCDFVSYDPRLPKKLRLFVRRFVRDDARIVEMEAKVESFLTEVQQVVYELENLEIPEPF